MFFTLWIRQQAQGGRERQEGERSSSFGSTTSKLEGQGGGEEEEKEEDNLLNHDGWCETGGEGGEKGQEEEQKEQETHILPHHEWLLFREEWQKAKDGLERMEQVGR